MSLLDGRRPACGRKISTEEISRKGPRIIEVESGDFPITLRVKAGKEYVIRETARGGVVMNRREKKNA